MSPSDLAGPQCSACGRPNGPNARFCKGCGSRLHQAVPDAAEDAAGAEESAPRPASDVCPRCGEVFGSAARACRNCGTKLSDSPPKDTTDPAAGPAPTECVEEEAPYAPSTGEPYVAPQPQSPPGLIVPPWARQSPLVLSLAALVVVLVGLLAWILLIRSDTEAPSTDTQFEEPAELPSSPPTPEIDDPPITAPAAAPQVDPKRDPPVERLRRPPPPPRATQLPEPTPSEAVSPTPAPVVAPQRPATPSLITSPTWARRPSGSDLARFYPDRAAERGVQGATVTECTIASDGSLRSCSILSEEPGGIGFGRASLQVMSRFRHASYTADGAVAAGARIRVPITWRLDED